MRYIVRREKINYFNEIVLYFTCLIINLLHFLLCHIFLFLRNNKCN